MRNFLSLLLDLLSKLFPSGSKYLDPSLSGFLIITPNTPQSFDDWYRTKDGQEYLKRIKKMVGVLNKNTPSIYTWINTSSYRQDGSSHEPQPAHDFAIRRKDEMDSRPSEFSEGELWNLYSRAQSVAQSQGIELKAMGSKHGTGPHLHVDKGKGLVEFVPTKYPKELSGSLNSYRMFWDSRGIA